MRPEHSPAPSATTGPEVPDPTVLCGLRDGVYAPDLLMAAVAELDLFSLVAAEGPVTIPVLCGRLGLSPSTRSC